MVGELSEDGQYMWDGNGWIPKPSSAEILPPSAVDQTQVMEVASQIGVNADSLANAAPYFDQNRDGQLQRSELEQAAVAIANPPPAGSRGGNGSPSSLKINNDNDDKPWQIKTVSILIIVMASLGGVIGQQVSKIDEKATKLENNAARNMSAARALETLENQDVFRDETMLVEAKSLLLQAKEYEGDIDNLRLKSEDSWFQLLNTDLDLTFYYLYLNSAFHVSTLTSTLCGDVNEPACAIYYVNEMTNDSEGVEQCLGPTLASSIEKCALRLVFNRQALQDYNFDIKEESFSASILWDHLENRTVDDGDALFLEEGLYSTVFVSDANTVGFHHFNSMGTEGLWECNYEGSICVDILIKPSLAFEAFPDFPETIIGGPSGLEYNAGDCYWNYIYSLETEIYVTELTIAAPEIYAEEGANVSDYEIRLAVLKQVLGSESKTLNLFEKVISNLETSHTDLIDKWYFSAYETDAKVNSLESNNNQSRTLIEDTSAWKKGFVSNITAEFISDESKDDYTLEAYSNSAAKYEVADNQSQEAADKRAKAGAVYSSILYISVATALCGVVSGRVGSNKYTMTLPMVLVSMGSFGYGCYIFASGIMI